MFTLDDLIINKKSKRLTYSDSRNQNSTEWNTRKTLLSDFQFLTRFLDSSFKTPICVYIGASSNINVLSSFFPNVIFHIYEAKRGCLTPSPKIVIFDEKFTINTALSYENVEDVLFISRPKVISVYKLRIQEYTKRGIIKFDAKGNPIGPYDLIREAKTVASERHEKLVSDMLEKQHEFCVLMKPKQAWLKFRLPYFIKGGPTSFTYFSGTAYWQPWAKSDSTETMLNPSTPYNNGEWDLLEYEEICSYHNNVTRSITTYPNIYTGDKNGIDYPELIDDYDSVAESMILKLYAQKVGSDDVRVVSAFSKLFTIKLNECYNTKYSLAKLRDPKFGAPMAYDPFAEKPKPVNLIQPSVAKSPSVVPVAKLPVPLAKSPAVLPVANVPLAKSPAVVPAIVPLAKSPAVIPTAKLPAIVPLAKSPAVVTLPSIAPTKLPAVVPLPSVAPTKLPAVVPMVLPAPNQRN